MEYKYRKIAVAIAALSFAAAVGARGDNSAANTSSSSSQSYSTDPSSSSSPSAGTSGSASMADSSTVRSAQQALKDKGYDPGAADGKLGPRTQSALRKFQQSQGLSQSGDLDQQTLSALGISQGGGTSSGSTTSSPSASSSTSSTRNQGSSYGSTPK